MFGGGRTAASEAVVASFVNRGSGGPGLLAHLDKLGSGKEEGTRAPVSAGTRVTFQSGRRLRTTPGVDAREMGCEGWQVGDAQS